MQCSTQALGDTTIAVSCHAYKRATSSTATMQGKTQCNPLQAGCCSVLDRHLTHRLVYKQLMAPGGEQPNSHT
jgi:hypothetical protein